jgi:hypothetical protein
VDYIIMVSLMAVAVLTTLQILSNNTNNAFNAVCKLVAGTAAVSFTV